MENDLLHLRDLRLDCRIGATAGERRRLRRINAALELECDLAPAGRSDKLADTIDYARLAASIRALARRRSWCLLESLAQALADACLAEPRVRAARVTLAKPRPVAHLGAAAVEIRRRRDGKSAGAT